MKALDSVMLQVLAYGKLKPGWNTQESVPPTLEAVKLACEFLRTIPDGFPLPGTMLSDNGSLGFYWHANQRHYIDLEIEADRDLFSFFGVKKETGDEPREETYLPELTIAHFSVPFYIEHFSAIRDEYAKQPATVRDGEASGVDSPDHRHQRERHDALRAG
jgi:hypothetical protein